MSDIVIKAENLGKKYTIGHQAENGRYTALRDVLMQSARSLWHKTKDLVQGKPVIQGDTMEEVWALKDVSFEIQRGEVVGIIGRNGAGKSTLLKVLSRITEPSAGRVTIKGRVASLLEVGTGFHPELTGRENIYLNGAIMGMTRQEIKDKFDEIVAFAEVEKFLDTPVKRYSSGMYVRLAFAVAAHLEAEILLVDEVLAVGDAQFQKKCLGKMEEVAKNGRTVLFVSHNMGAIQKLTSRCILLDNGESLLDSNVNKVVSTYLSKNINSSRNETLDTSQNDFTIKSISFNYEAVQNGFNKPLNFDLFVNLENHKYNLTIGFIIINSIGAKLMLSECDIDEIPVGVTHLTLILEDHHLPPGNYSINFGIVINGIQILHKENVLSFEILDLGIDNPRLTQKRDKVGAYIPCKYIAHKIK